MGTLEILITDESTAGLDPKQRISIRNYISNIVFNKIVLFSTHVVSDIEFIARDVIMQKKGVIVDNAPQHELTEKIGGKVWNLSCSKNNPKEMQEKFRVTNISQDEDSGNAILSVLSDEKPTEVSTAGHIHLRIITSTFSVQLRGIELIQCDKRSTIIYSILTNCKLNDRTT